MAADSSKDRNAARQTATFVPYFWEAYNEIVEPRRFDHYLVRRWMGELGPLGFAILKALRDRCYHNPATGVLRDQCEIDMEELARTVGVHRATLFREFGRNQALAQFVRKVEQFRMVNGHPEQAKNLYQVCMDDPIHPDDYEEYDLLRARKEQDRSASGTLSPTGARPKKQQGREARDEKAVESQNATQGQSVESQIATLESHSATVESQNAPPIEKDLPFGESLTKESLTPTPADAPPNIPPRGEADPLTVAWSHTLTLLAEKVNKPTFETHIKQIRPVTVTDTDGHVTVVLAAASAFSQEWVRGRHIETLRIALAEALGKIPETIAIEITRRAK
jgi:hypothetical protein